MCFKDLDLTSNDLASFWVALCLDADKQNGFTYVSTRSDIIEMVAFLERLRAIVSHEHGKECLIIKCLSKDKDRICFNRAHIKERKKRGENPPKTQTDRHP